MLEGPWPTPRDAASVILVRACAPREGAAYEVFLLRRHRKASFMSSTFVFPGGAADPDEDDRRVTAARELFEEAGVLLATPAPAPQPTRSAPPDQAVPAETLAAWRASLNAGETSFPALLARGGLALDTAALRYYAHWITPSVEPKRFSAQFYVAELPAGQTPSFDNKETVDEVWVTPAEALARAGELRLPPPQVHTFAAMRDAGPDLASLWRDADARAAAAHPIMPRMCPMPTGFALLLPWDPDYATRGTGDAAALPAGHALARGPSRFILEDSTWKNVHAAPPSPIEG